LLVVLVKDDIPVLNDIIPGGDSIYGGKTIAQTSVGISNVFDELCVLILNIHI